MKKFFGSIATIYLGSMIVFYSILLSCNSNDTTETPDTTTNTSTDTTSSTAPSTTNVVTDEKSADFLKKVTNAGMAEIQLAKLAQQKATLDAVVEVASVEVFELTVVSVVSSVSLHAIRTKQNTTAEPIIFFIKNI